MVHVVVFIVNDLADSCALSREAVRAATPMIVIAAATSTPRSTAKIALLSVFLALLRVVRLNEPTLRLDAKD